MISEADRAGHVLRVKAGKLAEQTVAEQYRRQPDLPQRYGPRGREYCLRDIARHLQFLTASVEMGDPGRFVRYVRWARDVMPAHGIPATDFLVTLQSLRDVAAVVLPARVAEMARRHVDTALADFPS